VTERPINTLTISFFIRLLFCVFGLCGISDAA
jgi:hypothetical protein